MNSCSEYSPRKRSQDREVAPKRDETALALRIGVQPARAEYKKWKSIRAKGLMTTMKKRRTREHVIADMSVNHVERFIFRCGWTVERTRHDYGIDLVMDTYNVNGEVENGRITFQLKATDALQRSADGKVIFVRLEWRDLLFWLNEMMPVILVLYDAQADQAYWLYVQEYFRQQQWGERARAATTVSVRIPAGNILDDAAIRQFARFRDECLPPN
jgi:hypothetical protein